jgi:hypothetical protein
VRLAHRLDLGSHAIGGPVELRTGLDVAGTGYSEALGGCEMRGDWADLSAVPGIGSSWAHGGLAASPAGGVIGFHAGQLVTFDEQGLVQQVVATELVEGHGLTLVGEGQDVWLWVSDPGFAFICSGDEGDEGLAALFGKGVRQVTGAPRVVKMRLDGEVVAELPQPTANSGDLAGSMGSSYAPTATAVDEERFGGTGDVWVADGYGSSLVHRFDSSGRHVSVLSGEEGAGRFDCPHALLVDRRRATIPKLYVTDRGNRRVQVYDLEGRYLRSFGEGVLNSPSALARWGELLVVAELFGRLAVFDASDRFVGYVGAGPDADVDLDRGWPERPGWPNDLSAEGRATPPAAGARGFTSPHSLAVDAGGNLYVSEWLLGGRYHKVTGLPVQHTGHRPTAREGAERRCGT